MPKICSTCGEKLATEQIVSGTEVGDTLVIVTKEELAELEEEQGAIEVIEFVPSSEVQPILLDSPYYLEPESDAGQKGYAMLRTVLAETDRAAVITICLKTRTRLGVLRAEGKTLVIQTLRWPDEIRDTGQLKISDGVQLSAKEIKMAKTLVEAYSVDTFDSSSHVDVYSQRREELVASKLDGAPEFTPVKAEPKTAVDDLEALLEASLKAKREAA
jgi:DNA end-binding protein Ku